MTCRVMIILFCFFPSYVSVLLRLKWFLPLFTQSKVLLVQCLSSHVKSHFVTKKNFQQMCSISVPRKEAKKKKYILYLKLLKLFVRKLFFFSFSDQNIWFEHINNICVQMLDEETLRCFAVQLSRVCLKYSWRKKSGRVLILGSGLLKKK